MKPLAIDLYCGLGGWAEGFLAEDYRVIGFDIERHDYGTGGYPAQMVIQDVMTLHGSQFRDAAVIVASPPCQEYSFAAMPWKAAKAEVPEVKPEWWCFPESLMSEKDLGEWKTWRLKHPATPPDTALFEACFRIQREAITAAGRYIPLIVENVRGAQKWVGRAKANFGSYYLWGDVGMVGRRVVAGVPRFGVSVQAMKAVKNPDTIWRENGCNAENRMVPSKVEAQKHNPDGTAHGSGSWFKIADSKNRGAKTPAGNCSSVMWKDREVARYAHPTPQEAELQGFNVTAAQRHREGTKNEHGGSWYGNYAEAKAAGRLATGRGFSSKSDSRKAASASIAKIPFPLSHYIAKCFKFEKGKS